MLFQGKLQLGNGTCHKGFKSTAALADHTVIHQTYVKKNIQKHLPQSHMAHIM